LKLISHDSHILDISNTLFIVSAAPDVPNIDTFCPHQGSATDWGRLEEENAVPLTPSGQYVFGYWDWPGIRETIRYPRVCLGLTFV
jgi:hypothetical protein